MQEKKHLLNLLKVLAILLIIHSHSDVLFPERLKVLATGGALGNGIFFILSGYLTKKKKCSWKSVLIRFCRLYFPVYIILILCVFFGYNFIARVHSIKAFLRVFIWPTPYWFVSASFACFVLLEVIKNRVNKKNYLIFLAIISVIYAVCYIWGMSEKHLFIVEEGGIFNSSIQFKCIYCFFLYAMGYFIKEFNLTIQRNQAFILMVISFILHNAVKILMQTGILPMQMQFLTQIFVIGFAVGALIISIQYEDQYRKCNKHILSMIDSISRVSLEAYVIQLRVIPVFAIILNIIFPLNYALSTLLIILLSYGLYYIDIMLMRFVKQVIE